MRSIFPELNKKVIRGGSLSPLPNTRSICNFVICGRNVFRRGSLEGALIRINAGLTHKHCNFIHRNHVQELVFREVDAINKRIECKCKSNHSSVPSTLNSLISF